MKILLICYLFSLPLLTLNNAAAESTASCPRRLKIGVSLPLTAGPIASGDAVRRSILLAKERYDTKSCVDFIFEDDQLLAKNTISIVDKFINVDHVDGLIVYGTPTSIAVGNAAERAKIPLIALSILSKVVDGKDYVVKHWCSAEKLNDAVVNEVKTRTYKKVAIVSTQNDAMLGLRDLFVSSGVSTVVVDEEFSKDNFEFGGVVNKLRAGQVDAIYVLLYPPQTALFMKKMREQKIVVEAFGAHNIEDPHEVESANGAMLGMWFANGDDGSGENYPASYEQRYSMKTVLGGGNGFDTAKMFIEAAHQDLSANDFLHQLKNFHGAFGIYSVTAKKDFNFPAVIKVIENEGFRKIH